MSPLVGLLVGGCGVVVGFLLGCYGCWRVYREQMNRVAPPDETPAPNRSRFVTRILQSLKQEPDQWTMDPDGQSFRRGRTATQVWVNSVDEEVCLFCAAGQIGGAFTKQEQKTLRAALMHWKKQHGVHQHRAVMAKAERELLGEKNQEEDGANE